MRTILTNDFIHLVDTEQDVATAPAPEPVDTGGNGTPREERQHHG